MSNYSRHERKFDKLFNDIFKQIKKPIVLEFGVSERALSTSKFLGLCEKENGMLYSVDTNDYSHHFKSNNWLFIQSRDDNFTYLKNILPNKFDIIYLDTIHSAKHVKKMFYKFYKA